MKPKTKLEIKVFSLHKKLPKLPGVYASWAYRKFFHYHAWKTKHKAACFECGHHWNLETNLDTKLFGIICPSCGKKLEARETGHHRFEEIEYFQVLDVVENFQVQRMFQIRHYCTKGYEAEYVCHEIFQHWMREDGVITTVALGANTMFGGYYYDHARWQFHYPMEIKHNNHSRYWIYAGVHPKMKILPIMYRNGFDGDFHDYNPMTYFGAILTNNTFETLVKTGQFAFLSNFSSIEWTIKKRWRQIKLCMRHGYIVKDASIWFDYLDLLVHFKYDLFNPKYICPDNLSLEHNLLVERKREQVRRNEEEIRKQKEYTNAVLRKVKKKMLCLSITQDNISIVPLKNVKDFKEEERVHDHCVYSSGYHKRDTSLILSARVDDIRMETIEISLETLKVLQCRGYDNKDSEYHKKILFALEKNMPIIKSMYVKAKESVVKREKVLRVK
jgi:hypothetical protein